MTDEEKEAYEKLQEKFELVPKKEQKKRISKKSTHDSENVVLHTIGIVKQPLYAKTFATSAILFGILYTFLYGLWRIPVIDFGFNRFSAVGILDYAYLLIITAITGLMFALFKYERVQHVKSGSKAGLGGSGLAGIVSAICPVCQGITITALGGTIATLPLAFLVPYIGLIQLMTVLILGFALYLKANSVYTQTCITCKVKVDKKLHTEIPSTGTPKAKEPFLYRNNIAFGALIVLVLMLVANNFLITTAYANAGASAGLNGDSVSLKTGFEYGSKVTLKPMPLATGESPRFQGYRTIVKPLPTISELSLSPPTGDVVQDLVNNVVPRGTPWYGQEAGVTFDDPIQAQQLWAKGRAIQLDAAEEQRWSRIVNSFTCDYCCGSPQNPTIITRCGCAHSAAAQGMAKWFVKNYGDKYSDEEIYGEMARWYALWYPGPTVKRIAEELQAAN
ncbi:MAG: hypothetical protein HYW26_04055 [Candidatus Aenigmarchaeota archaeon]|nr:hypothetical protein [Candidatus Aenigmarchaeota archaeon]